MTQNHLVWKYFGFYTIHGKVIVSRLLPKGQTAVFYLHYNKSWGSAIDLSPQRSSRKLDRDTDEQSSGKQPRMTAYYLVTYAVLIMYRKECCCGGRQFEGAGGCFGAIYLNCVTIEICSNVILQKM